MKRSCQLALRCSDLCTGTGLVAQVWKNLPQAHACLAYVLLPHLATLLIVRKIFLAALTKNFGILSAACLSHQLWRHSKSQISRLSTCLRDSQSLRKARKSRTNLTKACLSLNLSALRSCNDPGFCARTARNNNDRAFRAAYRSTSC